MNLRGNGDIIGATKIDEKILEEIRKSEALTAIRNEISETEIQIDNTNAQSFSNNNEEKITEEINIFEEYEEGFE